MKRFVIAVCIFISTLAFAVSGWFSVCKRIDSIVSVMKADREMIINEASISSDRTDRIIDEWYRHEKFLVSLLTHYELEEVEIGIKCLDDYRKEGLTEEYLKTLNECINHLEHVKATETPDIKNIF